MTRTIKKSAKRPKAGRKSAGKSPARRSRKSASSGAGKNLVIVESPAKARTINRYLGSDYVVKASMGHVRDLPKSDIGVDIEHGFQPTYEPLAGRRKVLAELKKYASGATQVFLATDLDRAGEAIGWHLAESLGVDPEKIRRVIFNEITRAAIEEAFANPQQIDMNKVDAQQARRILDRIVGYQISPLLWRKVAAGLSAGRVQSVAVRLIVDREREIERFEPSEYWRIRGVFTPDISKANKLAGQWATFLAKRDAKDRPPTQEARQKFLTTHNAFGAELVKWNGEKFQPDNSDEALAVARAIGLTRENVEHSENPRAKGAARSCVAVSGEIAPDAGPFVVRRLNHRTTRSRPPAPFTTVTMQQAAAVQLRFSASRTMRTAQQLYEGIDVPGEGSVGLITYMRTDSTHISNEAIGAVRSLIEESFGPDYMPEKPRRYAAAERAQQAHEAVRPTDVRRRPEQLRGALEAPQFKLYELIWKRFVASQMAPAVWKVTDADIAVEIPKKRGGGEATFKALGRTLEFDGFMRVAGRPNSGEQILPPLTETQPLAPMQLSPTQHFTQGPPRYTEASLVK
ncbi:MAG: type I DNA topoisomerase, partial [Planctomycetota bacterium]